MTMRDMVLASKIALSEIRHGWRHFYVFVACLVLGVAIMATVNSVGSVVKSSLGDEAQSLLGGHMEIRIRGVQATEEQQEFMTKYGDVSYVATLRSMLHFKERHTLVEIKAVDSAYPLIGDLIFNEDINPEAAFKDNGIVVDTILLSQMDAKVGDVVTIGEGKYTIRATVKNEPDRIVQIFSFGPRVMMNHEALQQSGLVRTFSLVEHRYRVLTKNSVLVDEAYEEQIEKELHETFPNVSWRVDTGTDGNMALDRLLNQLLAFMSLSGLATFLIAGIGIGSSVRSYLEKKSQTIAVLKVQGASRFNVLMTYTMVIGYLVIMGGIIGLLIASIVIGTVGPLLGAVVPVLEGKSMFHIPSLLLSFWYGFLIAYLFSLPALFGAVNVRSSMLFRSKSGVLTFYHSWGVRLLVGLFLLLLVMTLYFTSEDKLFILGAMGVIITSFVLFWLCSLLVRFVAKHIEVKTPWLKLALGNMHRPGSTTGTVIFAIGISLTVLIALTLTESNFQKRIVEIMNERAPSLFIIDIQPHQKEPIKALLELYADDNDKVMLYPMVRGRIMSIAGTPVSERKVSDDVDWAVRGDRGLSYSILPPANANIVKGEWWDEDYNGKPLLSVDVRFLKGMDVDIGDTITVKILGEEITAEIASARKIDYSTFQLNFAMMFSPGVIEEFPNTNLATVYLPKNDEKEFELISKIAKEFPGVTTIRTREVVELVRNVVEQIALALSVTVAISLIAGLLVLTSALSATIEQRMYDIAVLKVLGAQKSDILKSCTAEWMLLASVTSVIAAVIGTLSSYLINSRLRSQEFYMMPEVTFSTILLCSLVVWVIGYLGNRKLFSFRPASLLRND